MKNRVFIEWELAGRDSYEFPTLGEALKALKELFGHPVEAWPHGGGILMVRAYQDGDRTIVEGSPEFDPETWARRGANWTKIGRVDAELDKKLSTYVGANRRRCHGCGKMIRWTHEWSDWLCRRDHKGLYIVGSYDRQWRARYCARCSGFEE